MKTRGQLLSLLNHDEVDELLQEEMKSRITYKDDVKIPNFYLSMFYDDIGEEEEEGLYRYIHRIIFNFRLIKYSNFLLISSKFYSPNLIYFIRIHYCTL